MQWKDRPRDLDLHLFSFDRKTLDLVTHCYFMNKYEELGLEVGECMHLDVDDTQVCRIILSFVFVLVAKTDIPRYCLQPVCDHLLTHLQGNGHETMMLGPMNHQHTYVWMVHQYSCEEPGHGGMKDEYMSVRFTGVFKKDSVFYSSRDHPIPGPADSRWWLVGVAKMEGEWNFHVVDQLLAAETESGTRPDINALLPYIKQS